ncbi:MAG: ABC transporter substrate-binding protein [Curvibacter lanceolatus]|uniref:ABC transporter substrate-binding protein n=1 Tax=Curvibacter lanceolatus TaxID=86182 RepID=UPI000380D923|nr:ABC transporter substrate-binding protein [Curvibacter lanceolatus]MBV5294599.1 ABC transporter substrate-binding protein [Curvibacter lanceolatus]
MTQRLPQLNRRLLALLLAALPLAGASLSASAQGSTAKPQSGGTLTLATDLEPPSLVSFLDTNTRIRNISAKIVEGLLRYDSQFKPQPLLATSWSVSPDGLRYTFKLRPGVKWHDGKDFTAADVRFSLLAQKKQGPRGRITLANLERVDTPDPLTAVLVLSKPTPFLLKSLSSAELPIVPAHRYTEADPLTSPNQSAPIGTGPFVFAEWVRGSHLLLKKNPHYWQAGKPHLDRAVIKFIGDRAGIVAALEAGEIDVATNINLADLDRLAQNPKVQVDDSYDGFLNNAAFLEFNVEHPILAKPEVRQAIAHAIDRNALRTTVYYKRAEVVNSPVPSVLSSYYDDSTFQYGYDVARANQLLDQAGYPRQANGQRFALRITNIPGADFKRSSEFLRNALGRVGIKAELQDGDMASFFKRVYTARDFDLNINGLGRLFDPIVGVQRIYWSDGIKNPLIWINAAHYNNPQVDELFRQAAVEVDEGKRAGQFKQIQQIVGRELPVYPLVTVPGPSALNKRVHNFFNSIDLHAGDWSDAWVEGGK